MLSFSRQGFITALGLVLATAQAATTAARRRCPRRPGRHSGGFRQRPADGGFRRRLLLGSGGSLSPRQGRRPSGIRICRRGPPRGLRSCEHRHDRPRRIGPGDLRPAQVTYGELLRIFFSVAHDPTQLNRQGPDVGTQYRSAIFVHQRRAEEVAQAYIDQLDKAKVFADPIVTQVTPLAAFYPAESYHQNYLALHHDPALYRDLMTCRNSPSSS